MPMAVIAQFLPVVTTKGIMLLELPALWTQEEAYDWAREHWPGRVLMLEVDLASITPEKPSNGSA